MQVFSFIILIIQTLTSQLIYLNSPSLCPIYFFYWFLVYCWQHPLDNRKSKEIPNKIYFRFTDYATVFDSVDCNKLWKILKEMGIPNHLTCLLRNLYSGQEATELDVEQQTGSKSGKEYVKAIYYHPAYLTYIQSTSWEMLGWMKHKLESRL